MYLGGMEPFVLEGPAGYIGKKDNLLAEYTCQFLLLLVNCVLVGGGGGVPHHTCIHNNNWITV